MNIIDSNKIDSNENDTKPVIQDVSFTSDLQKFNNEFLEDMRRVFNTKITDETKDQVDLDLHRISDKVKKFEQRICSAQSVLSAYEKRKSRNLLNTMLTNLAFVRRSIFPRQRFSFASRKYLSEKTDIKLEEVKTIESDASHTVKDLSNVIHIVERPKNTKGGDFRLYNITNSVVILNFLNDTVYVDDCKNCVIVNGISEGAVHMERCTDCSLIFISHQIRMHESHNCTIAMLCGSRPIIERCDNFIIGSICNQEAIFKSETGFIQGSDLINEIILNSIIPNFIENLNKANLHKTEFDKNYTLIRDFSWIKLEASPNWSNNSEAFNKIIKTLNDKKKA